MSRGVVSLTFLLCFAAGALLTFYGARTWRSWTHPPAVLLHQDALLAELRDAEQREAWETPPERNVFALLERGRREFPEDPRFAEIGRRVSARLVTLATGAEQAGRAEDAIAQARRARELDPENGRAAELLHALTGTSVVPSAPMPSVPPPPRAPRAVPHRSAPAASPRGVEPPKGRGPLPPVLPPPPPSSEGARWL